MRIEFLLIWILIWLCIAIDMIIIIATKTDTYLSIDLSHKYLILISPVIGINPNDSYLPNYQPTI